jgi:arabinose-5-phosphate isomerase
MSEGRVRDVAGIGSMVVDRLHRIPRVLGAEEKGILRPMPDGRPEQTFVGGVVLNHLGWAAALGLCTGVFGKQAEDENGRFLRAAMDRLGIERNLVLDGSASSFAHIFVDDEGGRAIYMAPGATSETTSEQVRTRHTTFITGSRRVSTEVSQLPLAAVLEVLRIAEEAGIPSVLDLDVPPTDAVPGLGDQATLEAVLRRATLLKPAKAAARELLPGTDGDALAIAEGMRTRYGNQAVVVTDGEAGCAISAAGVALRVPAYAANQVIDTTGAGDAFLGGLLVALEQSLDWVDALKLANACGTACVERLGAFPEEPEAARARVLELYDGAPLSLAPPPEAPASFARSEAIDFFDVALAELSTLRERVDPAAFDGAVALIRAAEAGGGRVHVTGIGKPEHVAHYAASVLSSTGTPATFLHGTEAVHGSAGQVVSGDVVIAISNSGETEELHRALEAVRGLGAKLIAVTGELGSRLGRIADVVLDAGVAREGGGLGFAPRNSVAAEVLVLAALSALLESERGFRRAEYHARHPSGKLGETSSRVSREA